MPTGLRLPEAGWRKTFQQKVKASESTFLAYAAPTSRSNRLPPGVPGAAFVALNVTAPPAVVAAARGRPSLPRRRDASLSIIIVISLVA